MVCWGLWISTSLAASLVEVLPTPGALSSGSCRLPLLLRPRSLLGAAMPAALALAAAVAAAALLCAARRPRSMRLRSVEPALLKEVRWLAGWLVGCAGGAVEVVGMPDWMVERHVGIAGSGCPAGMVDWPAGLPSCAGAADAAAGLTRGGLLLG